MKPKVDFQRADPDTSRPNPFRRSWLVILAGVAGLVFWGLFGQAYFRRIFNPPRQVAEARRDGAQFIALAFPRIVADDGVGELVLPEGGIRTTMSRSDFKTIIRALDILGYTSVGLSDVRDYYLLRRPLPPRAVLIGLERDSPASVHAADRIMSEHGMKGVIFLNQLRDPRERKKRYRHGLNGHTISQLIKSGAWEFGWTADEEPTAILEKRAAALLDREGLQAWTRDLRKYPVRFIGGRVGYNGEDDALNALRMFRVRPERPVADNIRLIHGQWPRRRPFVDEFQSGRLALDWMTEFGLATAAHERLGLIPLPYQTGAAVFLTGTDSWRDVELEFEVKRHQRDFWANVRLKDGDHWLRVGVQDGHWLVQQKTGPNALPVTLGRAPLVGSLPARLHLIVKGSWALLEVDGRRQFGKALAVHPAIGKGRVQFDVYDSKLRTAAGFLGYVKAAPLPQRWLSLDVSQLSALSPAAMDVLRREARAAQAVTLNYRWAGQGHDADVDRTEFVRSLAGFDRCLLVPSVDFTGGGFQVPEALPAARRLAEDLVRAVDDMEGAGLNVRLPASGSIDAAAARFLGLLREKLRAQRRLLWITLEGSTPPALGWFDVADGVLRPAQEPPGDVRHLEAYLKEDVLNAAGAAINL